MSPRPTGAGSRPRPLKRKASKARQIGQRPKETRADRTITRLQKSAARDPERKKHKRDYKKNERYVVTTIPAPTVRQQTVTTLNRRMLRTGVLTFYTEMPDVLPVTDLTNSTSERIRQRFPTPRK